MATAVKLVENGGIPTTHLDVKGLVLEGLDIQQRLLQEKLTKFWGVDNESRIHGGIGGREFTVPVLIYDATDFDTARKLSDYIDVELNTTQKGLGGTLTITSESDHAPFDDCRFGGATLVEGAKKDTAGTLGGGYWAICLLFFRQMS